MMLGGTLSRYLARAFARWIVGFFLLGAGIILLADFLELVRRSADREAFSAGGALLTSLLRTPSLTEEFLPFAVLFGAIGAFVALNRRFELVTLRAAGVSVWQFIVPPLAVAVVAGAIATLVYNPISAYSRDRADDLAVSLLGDEQRVLTASTSNIWFRQEGADGSSIMHAASASADGRSLFQETAYVFGADQRFAERIHARAATLDDGLWIMSDVIVFSQDGARSQRERYVLPTFLSPVQVRDAVSRPSAISFWQLPDVVRLAEQAGLPVHRYQLQFQVLLARPLLLAAMILLAAAVSLRLARLGGTARAVTGGVAAGFVLYLASEVAGDLGRAGVIAPSLAAWTPGFAAALFGASSLLRSEDG